MLFLEWLKELPLFCYRGFVVSVTELLNATCFLQLAIVVSSHRAPTPVKPSCHIDVNHNPTAIH